MSYDDPTWRALVREGGVAHGALTTGLAALRRANHADHAQYSTAFFQLSIGIEHLCKLVLVIEYALTNEGRYPTDDKMLRQAGHDLVKLVAAVEQVRAGTGAADYQWELPDRRITNAMLGVLDEFARRTRYWHLDHLTSSTADRRDPLAAWYEDVATPLLAQMPEAKRAKIEAQATEFEVMLGDASYVLHTTESGEPIRSPGHMAAHGQSMDWVQEQATFHGATLVRYLTEYFSVRSGDMLGAQMPFLYEYFGLFNNEDRYLRGRKTFGG